MIIVTNNKKTRQVKILRETENSYVVRWIRPSGFSDEMVFDKATGKSFKGNWKIA